jgi:hypothetical protein
MHEGVIEDRQVASSLFESSSPALDQSQGLVLIAMASLSIGNADHFFHDTSCDQRRKRFAIFHARLQHRHRQLD